MEVELSTNRDDVDQLWSASRAALRMKPPPEKEHRDAATKQADSDRNSRTNVVIAWIGTNMWVIHYDHVKNIADGELVRLG
jgi:chitin synthase